MPKESVDQRSSDDLRKTILRYFYNKHKQSRSLSRSRLKISKIKADLKKDGMDERQIAANLDYLIQTGWVHEITDSYQVATKGRVITTQTKTYKISDKGIDHFEGPSQFQKQDPFGGINITNVQGVTVLGDGNVVHTRYNDLYDSLNDLSGAIKHSHSYTDEEKLNLVSEIETIKSQLSKVAPDKGIVSRAWDKLTPLATVAGIANFVEKTWHLLRPIIGA